MSTLLAHGSSLALAPPNAQRVGHPQNDSWRLAASPWRTIQLWMARRDQRAALRDLADTPHLLADIGLTREQALKEAAKPFWRK